jgi:D-amino-acid dehydrogenase
MELVDGKGLREIEPALSPDYKSGLIIQDQARALHPGELGKALADKAKKLGAVFLRHEIIAIKPGNDGQWLIETDGDTISASKLLIAAGAWSPRLLEPLGIRLPLEYERGYHLEFRSPGVELQHSIMDLDKKFVTSAMSFGIRSAGTAEFAGLDAEPDYRRAEILKTLTKAMLPDLNVEDTKGWMGVRPSFPDSLPCIDQLPGFSNLYGAFGHSHFGLGMAPKTGEIIADILANRRPNIDLSAYSAKRFL